MGLADVWNKLRGIPRSNTALDAEFVAVEESISKRSPLIGAGNLSLWSERIYNATTGTTGQSDYRVGVMHCGDSLAERICGWISIWTAHDFHDNQGRGLGNTTNGLTSSPNNYHQQTGTLADATGDASRLTGQFSLWPDGLVYDAGSGTGVLTFPPRRVTTLSIYENDPRTFTTIKVAYIASSGAGTFDIETSPDGTTWTKQGATVSTSNATTIGAITSRTVTEGVYHVRVKHVSGGRIKVIGLYTGFAKSVIGYDGYAMSQGGITPVQWSTTPLAIVTPILTDLDPALITFHFADTNADIESTFDAVMAIARAGNSKRSVLWVASHSYSNPSDQAAADSDTELTRQFLLSKVESSQIAVLDVRGFSGNWANVLAFGWEGDGVHLDPKFYQYCYSFIEQSLPIQAIARKRFDPDTIDNLPQLFATQNKAFGTVALADITEPGINYVSDGTGMPNNDQGVVISFGVGPESTHPFSLFAVQLATNPYNVDTGWYRRTRTSGTWGSWVSLGSMTGAAIRSALGVSTLSGSNTGDQTLPTRTSLSINNVDNTSDANKPISTAQQTALNLKADTSAVAAGYQPLDADLTAIAALATTSTGRALLTESVAQTGTGGLVRASSPTVSGTLNAAAIAASGKLTSTTGVAIGAGVSATNAIDILATNANESRILITRNISSVLHTGAFNVDGAGASYFNASTGIKFGINSTVSFEVLADRSVTFANGVAITGNATASGTLRVGGGTVIQNILSATATLDFASIAASSFQDLTITVTGAASGDTVIINPIAGSATTDVVFTGWVSASNTVTIRASNVSATTARDPASGTFRATVIKF